MKTAIHIALMSSLCIPLVGYGQLEKGGLMNSFALGISYNHLSEERFGNKTTLFRTSLEDGLGYFVLTRFALGPGLSFEYGSSHMEDNHLYYDQEDPSEFDSKWYAVSICPFLRYYFAKLDKLAFFFHMSGGFGFSHYNDTFKYWPGHGPKSKTNNLLYSAGLGVGLDYFLTKNIALEAILKYTIQGTRVKNYEFDYTDHETQGFFVFGLGMNFFLHP